MNPDFLFSWGDDVDGEIEADVLACLIQPRRSLFYDRSYGAGIPSMENSPNSLIFQVMIKYEAEKAIGIRNQVVTDGTNGPDRRVAASQGDMEFQSGDNGEVSLSARYLTMKDRSSARISIPIGGV